MEMIVLKMMPQMVSKNNLQHKFYKRGELISLFILCLLPNLLYAQFGFENWLHNDVRSNVPYLDNYISVYHDYDIGESVKTKRIEV